MTGKELIKWIHDHKAEEMNIVIQYRDAGGDYEGGETPEPIFAEVKNVNTSCEYDINYCTDRPNAVIL